MKYLVKYISEWQTEFDAPDTDTAVKQARHLMAQMPSGTKLHGVVREDIGWPDTQETVRPTPPGRGPPPSGTPSAGAGTMCDQVEEFLFERAAA